MSGASSIEWTDATWNPVRGCSRVSEGCRHCYAERFAARFAKPKGADAPAKSPAGGYAGFVENTKAGPRWTGRVELIPEKLDEPLRWKKPRRIFVNSMSDLFHERLSNESIAAVFGVMAACPQHTFQILTKRPERMLHWFRSLSYMPLDHTDFEVRQCLGAFDRFSSPDARKHVDYPAWPLTNAWLGVSVEDQATADERIPLLLATPAAVRFVSFEPALEAVDFRQWLRCRCEVCKDGLDCCISWLIVGGESGPGARPFDIAWARSTVEQCKAAGAACFVEQLGARPIGLPARRLAPQWREAGADAHDWHEGLFARNGGDWSEWSEDLRVREFPR